LMALLLPRFLRSDGLLVLELPVVHDLADGRFRQRRHLHEIKVRFLGRHERLLTRDDPDLRSVRADQAHLGGADTVVDPILRRCDCSPSLRYATSLLVDRTNELDVPNGARSKVSAGPIVGASTTLTLPSRALRVRGCGPLLVKHGQVYPVVMECRGDQTRPLASNWERQPTTRTFAACFPFGPSVMSNSTF
jgi:hypothetical protein